MIFRREPRTPLLTDPFPYTARGEGCTLGVQEIAELWGLSVARVRQLVGSREDHPVLLPPDTRVSSRSTQWLARDVVRFSLSTDRDMTEPPPAMVALPSGRNRYVPIGYRVSSASHSSTHLTVRQSSGRPVTVYTSMYFPEQYRRCGHEEHSVLMLTPTWPTTALDVRSAFLDILEEAFRVPGWDEGWAHEQPQLMVGMLGFDDDVALRRGTVPMRHIDTGLLARVSESVRIDRHQQPRPLGAHPIWGAWDDIDVPATEVASCLGLQSLPYWPSGSVSAESCAMWRPGVPVRTRVPACEQTHQEAIDWVTQRASQVIADPNVELVAYEALAADMQRTTTTAWRRGDKMKKRPLGPGFERAITFDWPEDLERPDRVNPEPALSAIASCPQAPPRLADAIFTHFGDWAYSYPVQVQLEHVPTRWRELIEKTECLPPDEMPLVAPAGSARARALWAQHGRGMRDTSTPPRWGQWGPNDAPFLLSNTHLTWVAPNNDRAAVPRGAQQPYEVLMMENDLSSTQTRGLYRTLDGELGPIPAGRPGSAFLVVDAAFLKAVITQTPFQSPWDQIVAEREASEGIPAHPLEAKLDAPRVHGEPVAMPWSDLEAAAKQPFTTRTLR